MKYLMLFVLVYNLASAKGNTNNLHFVKANNLDIIDSKELVVEKSRAVNSKKWVIIAPGFADGKFDPMYRVITKELTEAGFNVLRFSWLEMLSIKDPHIDNHRLQRRLVKQLKIYLERKYSASSIGIIAKSWGARITANFPDDFLRGFNSIVLLAPNCSSREDFDERYSKVLSLIRDSKIIISKEDPYCKFKALENSESYQRYSEKFTFLEKSNHGFRLSSSEASYKNFLFIAKKMTDK